MHAPPSEIIPKTWSPTRLKTHKYTLAAWVAVKNRLAYPAEFLGPLLVVCLLLFVQSRIWATAFADTTQIAGYTRAQLSWYVVWTETVYFTANGFFPSFTGEIKDGQIAYTLGRPYSVLWYTVSQRLGLGSLNLLTVGLVGGLEMSLCAGPWPLTGPVQLGVFALSMLLGMCLQILCQTLLAMTAFWMEENSALYWIWSKFLLILGTLLPVELLPQAWQGPVFLTPFPWIMWAPAKIGTAWPGLEKALSMVAVQAALAAVLLFLAGLVFRRATRKLTIQGG